MSGNTIVFSKLNGRQTHSYELRPKEEVVEDLRDSLDLIGLRKVRLEVTVHPMGQTDWRLEGKIGATVVQPCVVTLDPVTTRLDETFERKFLAEFVEPDAAEAEMDEDDTVEALPAELDLLTVLQESLALALPPYPRSDAADGAQTTFAEPGVTPMSDEDVKPFASLQGLRDKLTENKL